MSEPTPPMTYQEWAEMMLEKSDTPQPSAVSVTRDFYELRIYLGDVLHLHIDSDKFIGMQAWTDNEHSYTIEYTLTGGTLRTEYTTEDKWKAVLAGLEKVL